MNYYLTHFVRLIFFLYNHKISHHGYDYKCWILNKILRILCWYFTTRVFIFIKSTIYHDNNSIQQDGGYSYQHTGLNFEEKDIEMLHLSLSFMDLKIEHFRTRSEILSKFWNVVSEKVGDQLDRSYEA